MQRSWNHARGYFVDRYGGERLDASLLLLPLVGFLPADDPRMSPTIDAIERELSKDGLVWRGPRSGDTEQGHSSPARIGLPIVERCRAAAPTRLHCSSGC